MDERDLSVLSQLPGPLREMLIDQINKKIGQYQPQYPVNPMEGLDNPALRPPAPVIPPAPWTGHIGSNEATLNLPANPGASFQVYMNYNFNPFSGGMGFRGLGLRYRYEF